MGKLERTSPFRLSSLLRLQKDPKLAFQLFLNPNPNDPNSSSKPFRYSLLSYDLIICKLGRAKMFNEMEKIIEKLRNDTRIMPKEVIFCNIISFYGRARLHRKAHQMFDEIPSFRCQRTIKSVNTLLNSLLMCGKFDEMTEVIRGIEKYACPDVYTYNILINACCVIGNLDNAWGVFDEMRRRGLQPNVVTFGTLIHGLCANSELDEAFKLKEIMERDFRMTPNAFVYVALIKQLCKCNEVDSAIKLKEEMLQKKVGLDSAVYATLISALFKADRKDDVFGLLEEMRMNGCKTDIVTYNAMIHGYCLQKDFGSALGILKEMEEKGCKPDVISYNVIIGGLCMDGKIKEANELFEDMPRRKCLPDIITYRTLFDGLCGGMLFKEAAFILDEMVFKNYLPRSSSVCKLVEGITQAGDTELLRMVSSSLAKGKFTDVTTWRMMVSMVYKKDNLSIISFLDTLREGKDDCVSSSTL
ncbi:hypothetical protein M9H77_21685 [Catharanthus roseus]|uniref:Uncharacterized protein n=1 Tax=Catharanthus roseus TaxID=4058 RepID=A0ACC0APJ3_CATRO|nr:hypothetical protein M9H77_21685 [Catharanthus roseus]